MKLPRLCIEPRSSFARAGLLVLKVAISSWHVAFRFTFHVLCGRVLVVCVRRQSSWDSHFLNLAPGLRKPLHNRTCVSGSARAVCVDRNRKSDGEDGEFISLIGLPMWKWPAGIACSWGNRRRSPPVSCRRATGPCAETSPLIFLNPWIYLCIHRPGNCILDTSFVCVLLSIAAAAPEFRVSNPPLGDSADQVGDEFRPIRVSSASLPTTKSVPELRLVARIVLFPCATVSRLGEVNHARSPAVVPSFHALCRRSTIALYQKNPSLL